jgi:hypothetical protein
LKKDLAWILINCYHFSLKKIVQIVFFYFLSYSYKGNNHFKNIKK